MATANGSPRARALAAALRQARNDRGISARQLANKLSIDQALLSRIETGKRIADVETTARILGALGTASAECERILDIARHANEPNWLTTGVPGIPQQLAGAVASERDASVIMEWSPMIIPGLLQTNDYVRGVAQADGHPKHVVESRVMVRVSRREILTKRNPVHYEVLVGDVALRQKIGSNVAMIDQLRYLIKFCAENSNVTLRVVPIRTGWHPGTAGPFVLYEFSDAPPYVHFEHYSSSAFVTDSDDVDAYRKALDMIGEYALSPSKSIDLMAQTIVEEHQKDEPEILA